MPCRAVAVPRKIVLIATISLDIIATEVDVVLFWLNCWHKTHQLPACRIGGTEIERTLAMVGAEASARLPALICTTSYTPGKAEAVNDGGSPIVADLVGGAFADM